AAITGEREDYTLAIKEMTYKAAGSIVGNVVTRNIRKIPFLHKLVNKYSRNFTDKKVGAFSKEVITTTNDVISSGTGKIVSSGAERASSSRAERTASSGAKSIGSRIRDFFGKNKRESEE
uniref:hypothetical protein n=1 Tax=uncultured Cohaesibacter sp. TaxID=1002546 RepID=UPI00292FBC07